MGLTFAHRGIRFLLLIAILAVSGLTLSSFLARKRERGHPQPLPPKIAAGVDQQTQAFSLSKTSGGRPLYKVQASQVTNFKDTGKTILHNVSIEIFGKNGDRLDRITSQECEFDQAKGFLFIPGEVEMELEAPVAEPVPAARQQPSGPIYLSTSGLSFDQNTGVATTDKEVRFRFAGGEGSSQGATYDPQDQMITMTAQAQFTLWQSPSTQKDSHPPGSGAAKEMEPGGPSRTREEGSTHVQAGSLRFRHSERKILLSAPVEITQGTRRLQAGDSEIFLDEQERAQRASLGGGVHGADHDPLRPSEVRASRSEMEFTPQGKVRKLLLDGTTAASVRAASTATVPATLPAALLATWATASVQSREEGQAQRVEMFFEEASGQLSRVEANGKVRVILSPSRGPSNLPLLRARPEEAGPGEGSRILLAEQAEMILAPDGETLREVRTRSSSTLQLFPAKPGEDQRTVQAEKFNMEFSPAGDMAEFSAEENVRLSAEGTGKTGRKRLSSSDHLLATFDPRTHAVSRTRQWGNFHYQDPDQQASAQQADYTAQDDKIVLQGEPLAWNSSGKLSAEKITLLNGTSNSIGEVTAEGRVATTYFSASSPGSPPPEPIHVVAERLQYDSKTAKALYQGNARLWQGSDLIEAGSLELDRQNEELLARDGVYSVFPERSEPQNKKTTAPASGAVSPLTSSGPIEIRSKDLVYKQGEHRAVYRGEVRMQNATATLTSGELEILFKPSAAEIRATPAGGSWQIERAIATGDVAIVEPMRKATGNRAEYIPQESKVILLGNLATVADSQRGTTQGARLTYFTGDGRIFVQGEPGSPAETRRLVQR